MFNIVQRRKWFFLFSGILILAGLVSMAISVATYPEHSPVRLSIDFIVGSLLEMEFKALPNPQPTGAVTEDTLTSVFSSFGLKDIRIQRLAEVGATAGNNRWQVRTSYIDNETTEKLKTALDTAAKPLGLQLDRETISFNQVTATVG